MRVIDVTEFGGPDVLQVREAAVPTAKAGEVLVAVSVVEILHLDTQLRSGWGRDFFPMRPPWVPGTGVAGTVAAVGEDVDPRRIGERVIARTGDEGAYAEYVTVPVVDVFTVPDGLDPVVATAALHDGVQALEQLSKADLAAGSRVLVTGAAGALGHWLVPLAARAGAEVIGAAGGPHKTAAVALLGAAHVVDYDAPGWPERVGGPVDVVFDGVGGAVGRAAAALLRPGGALHAYGAASGDFGSVQRPDVVVHGIGERLADERWERLTKDALRLLAEGVVTPRIGQRVPFARAAAAHAAIAERRVVGKSVLLV